ncbi:MAG: DUF2252 family protein [Bryobacterales bacterium]|nr:DUF2252 family protein [Bryobacterales bacterium]
MPSAVDRILEWHQNVSSPQLQEKLRRLCDSPFRFYRGTFFLFAADVKRFRASDAGGLIVGDVHAENYGAYRSVTGDIVYDINDFDEATSGAYEWDVLRLTVSLMLASLGEHRFGDTLHAAEAAVRAWLDGLRRWDKYSREQFEHLPEAEEVRELLKESKEESRTEFLKKLVKPGRDDVFHFRDSDGYERIPAAEPAVRRALAGYLSTCLAPKNAVPSRYVLQDVATRQAGTGSMGRHRYALLLDKGLEKKPEYSSLRLVEWKQSLDSALDSARPHAGRRRAEQVFAYTTRCQLFPKRYLGTAQMSGMPMQAREIGANDQRFSPKRFATPARLSKAAAIFGGILARCHLLGANAGAGPRTIPDEIAGYEDRYVNRLLGFTASYAAQVCDEHAELLARRDEVERAWQR